MIDCGGVELLHATTGRIRIRVPEVKGNAPLAREIQHQLADFRGVRRVEASPLTGSVLVIYDPASAESVEEWARLLFPGIEEGRPGACQASPDGDPSTLAQRIVDYCTELNTDVKSVTGGHDLKVLLPTALFVFGIKGLLFSKNRPLPTWYDLMWFSFGTFLMLNNRKAAAADPPAEREPSLSVVRVNGVSG
jgi:hypothetical protein